MIIGIIIGIIFWQLIFTAITIISKENDEVMAYTGIGIWIIPAAIAGKIYKTIRTNYIKNHYNGYRFCVGDNTHDWIYIHNRDISKFITDETAKYHIKKYSDGKSWKSIPYSTELYKNQEYYAGWEIAKFLKNSTL